MEICISWRIPASTLNPPRKSWWKLRCARRTWPGVSTHAARGHAFVLQLRQHPPPAVHKVRKAVELLHKADPTLIVDGEIEAEDAVSPEAIEKSILSAR